MMRPVMTALACARCLPKSALRRTFASSAARTASYGFIGLGRMGLPMAKNLRARIAKDDTLVVFDVDGAAVRTFMDEHGETRTESVSSVRQVAEKSDTIITSLPEPSHVQSVFDTILATRLPPKSDSRLFIDCSTIDPITSRAVAKKVTDQSAGDFVDAPMSGGVVGARAATLTFMVGCGPDLLQRATTALSYMGKRVVHLGDQGAGLCGKLANNYLLALNNIATAEAMSMGVQWGLDPKALAGMINTSTGRCWPSEVNNPVPGVVDAAPASRDYEGGFGISLMAKDLRLAMAAADDFGVKNGLGKAALDIYQQAQQDARCKNKDFSVVYRWLGGPESSKS